jgi:hypothetical protein
MRRLLSLAGAGLFAVFNVSTAWGIQVLCESEDGERTYCDVRDADTSDIMISRRLSDAPCSEGRSWGRSQRGIWVDRGCRAEFTVERQGSGGRGSAERCPPGFEPGNHRCTNDERRQGCKDMRMPGGTTCNSRGWS